MKNTMMIVATVAALTVSSAPAVADALMDAMRECMAVEKDKPNSTRGGLSANEYCATQAIIQTKN